MNNRIKDKRNTFNFIPVYLMTFVQNKKNIACHPAGFNFQL